MFHVILVAIDGSGHTAGVIAAAADLATATGAALHIFCAVDPAYFLDEPDGGHPSTTDAIDYPAAATEREGADALVRQIVADLRGRGLNAHGAIVGGEPVDAILSSAGKLGCDTIVLGHRHLSWLGRMADRSVCHEVLERVHIPVLVIPPTVDSPAPAAGRGAP